MPNTNSRVADLLDKLANGDTVALGEFSNQASPATDADEDAATLREIAHDLRADNGYQPGEFTKL